MEKLKKNLGALVMAFAMLAGLWCGMKLDARAYDWEMHTVGEDLQEGMFVKTGDVICFPQPDEYLIYLEKAYKYSVTFLDPNGGVVMKAQQMTPIETEKWVDVPECSYGGKTYVWYKVIWGSCNDATLPKEWRFTFQAVEEAEVFPPKEADKFPPKETDKFPPKETDNYSETPAHTCNFQWTTTLDPSAGVDGLEEYKCIYCGAVQESHAIPAGIAYVKELYGDIKNAPVNGSITYDSGRLYTISDYLLKKMAERNDVAVTVTFEYQNKKYQLTFPAGLDYRAVLEDEELMYGYFGVAAKLGLKVAEQ